MNPVALALPAAVASLAVDDALGGIPVGQLTPAGLLGVIVMLIALGRLVPRRTMEDAKEDGKNWREAYFKERDARLESQRQMGQLLDINSETLDAFLKALPRGVELAREDSSESGS